MLCVCHYVKFNTLTDPSIRSFTIAFNIISLLLAATGNIITMTVIGKVPKLRRQPTYLFIGSVCFADAMVALAAQPLYIAILLLDSKDPDCALNKGFFVFGWLGSFGSVVGINMVTFDRFIYIMRPLR